MWSEPKTNRSNGNHGVEKNECAVSQKPEIKRCSTSYKLRDWYLDDKSKAHEARTATHELRKYVYVENGRDKRRIYHKVGGLERHC